MPNSALVAASPAATAAVALPGRRSPRARSTRTHTETSNTAVSTTVGHDPGLPNQLSHGGRPRAAVGHRASTHSHASGGTMQATAKRARRRGAARAFTRPIRCPCVHCAGIGITNLSVSIVLRSLLGMLSLESIFPEAMMLL